MGGRRCQIDLHLPFKYEEDKYENIRLLNNRLENRGMPSSRENYEAILAQYGVNSSKDLTLLGTVLT